jgi:hypothetical protein
MCEDSKKMLAIAPLSSASGRELSVEMIIFE